MYYVWVARKKPDRTKSGLAQYWYISRTRWNGDGAFHSKLKASLLAALLKKRGYSVKVEDHPVPSLQKSATESETPPSGSLDIVTRSEWGAGSYGRLVRTDWTSNTPTRVHHTAGLGSFASQDAEKLEMRNLQKFHVNTRGYADIGYNYVIFPSGRVYEGRGYERKGAHTLGHNDDIGISFAGDYTKQKLTNEQIASYKSLRKYLGVSASGDERPHSATFSTSCPGSHVKAALGL
jgi:hypothetical protein